MTNQLTIDNGQLTKKKLSNLKCEMSKGFTMIEMLVVISILAIVGVMILNIFTRTLRSSNKSQIIGVIKQNGQSVLEMMDKTIRNSDNVVCPVISPPDTVVSSSQLVVVNKGIYTRYRFIAPSPVTNPTVNGLIQQDNPAKQNVQDSDPLREETDSEFRNRACSLADTLVNPVFMTGTKSNTGVSVNNGVFTRDRSDGFKDQVTIKFDLKPGVSAFQSVAGQIDTVSFQTTINLR